MKTIRFIRLHLHNFLSYRDAELEFRNGLWLVNGMVDGNEAASNGAGKTAIAEAIYFALYGKPLRKVSLDELVNAKAGEDCWVALWMDDEYGELGVARFRKSPINSNALVVSLPDRADLFGADAETALRSFFPLDEDMFANMVMFGRSDKLALFSKMSDTDRKAMLRTVCPQVVELEKANQSAIEIRAANSAELADCETRYKIKMEQVKNLDDTVDMLTQGLEKNRVDWEADKLELEKSRAACLKKHEHFRKLWDKEAKKFRDIIQPPLLEDVLAKDGAYKKLRAKMRSAEQAYQKEDNDFGSTKKELASLEGKQVCPLCKRPYDNAETLAKRVEHLRAKQKKCVSAMNRYNAAYAESRDEAEGIKSRYESVLAQDRDLIQQKVAKREEYHQNMMDEKAAATNIENQIQNGDRELAQKKAHVDSKRTEAQKAGNELRDLALRKAALQKEQAALDVLHHATGPSGLPAYIVDDFLRLIEEQANSILARLSDKLSVSITSGKTLEKYSREGRISISSENQSGAWSYGGNSSGEATRVDFAILFGLVLAMQQVSGVDVQFMFLDEIIDGALDESGTEEIMRMLQDVILPLKGMIYVTSHRTDIKDQFDNILTVCKDGGESRFA